MQLQVAAVQLQQYQAGLELAARQYTESLQNRMREVENMEFVNQQEATQQMRLFEENISREAWSQLQKNNEEMQAYTHRYESYIQYEQGEVARYKNHAELLDQQSKSYNQELRQVEHVLAVNKDKVVHT